MKMNNEQMALGLGASLIAILAYRRNKAAKEVSKLDWHRGFAGSNGHNK